MLMVVRTKLELIDILIQDSKIDVSDPIDYKDMANHLLRKSNLWFIRSFAIYDYKLIVLPNEKFEIR